MAGWAQAFDDWVRDRLETGDVDAIAAYERLAPQVSLAVPTSEHFDPLLVALGATAGDGRCLCGLPVRQPLHAQLRGVGLTAPVSPIMSA